MVESILVVVLTLAIFVLLFTERVSLDAIGIGLLVVLVASGEVLRWLLPGFDPAERLLSYDQALVLFGNGAVLTIAALYVMGEGLSRTGAVEFVARGVLHTSGGRERRIVFLVALVSGLVSAFLNNTAVALVFIPVILDLSKETHIPPSRLLLPMAFGAILGGTCTLVGTSTNLLVSGVAELYQMEPIGMFEMSPLGVVLLLVGVLFLTFWGKRILPDRHSLSAMMSDGGRKEYVTELVISPQSRLRGMRYAEAFRDTRAELLFFARGDTMVWPPYHNETIEAGDVVMLRGDVDSVAGLRDDLGLRMVGGERFDPRSMTYFELAVSPHSNLLGRKIGELNLHRDYGVVVIAVLRDNLHIRERASELRLQPGDVLLVCGDDESKAKIRARSNFYLLTGAHHRVRLRARAKRALAIAGATIAAFTVLSLFHRGELLPFAALGGALAMVGSGCLTTRRAYRAVDWPILLFIIGTLGLGAAMDNSGVATAAGHELVALLSGAGPFVVLSALSFVCIALTSLVSNNAVAVLLTPIAVHAAQELGGADFGLDQARLMRAFVLTVAFSASISFVTHWSHQVNLMVYGPGGYKPTDVVRLGIPLALISWVLISLGVPILTGLV